MLLRHVVQHHQHAAAGLVREGGQEQLQRPVAHLHLRLGIVGPLEGQRLLEGIDPAEEGVIGGALRHAAMEHVGGGGIAVDQQTVVVKGHHAVGHVQEQGIQLVALVFHGGQGGLQDPGHLIERAGEDADLIGGLHRQLAVEVPGGHPLGSGGELFDGAHHGLGQQEAQQYGDQQADDQCLHDDEEDLGVQVGDRVLVVQNVDDIGIVAPYDGDGYIHVVGGDVAAVSHPGAVPLRYGVPGGEQVCRLFPGERRGVCRAVQVGAALSVQNKVVPGAVVDAQGAGTALQHLLEPGGSIRLSGPGPEGGDIAVAVVAEHGVDLFIKGVDIEAGDAGGQERAHHRHQRGDEQQQDQRQLHVQAAEHGKHLPS